MPAPVFNVEIRFTGICAFVPDVAFAQSPKKICVVMPHAFFEDVGAPPDAADDHPLRRHRAMVQFPLSNMPGFSAPQPDATAVWYLERQRLTFVTTPDPDPDPNKPALTVGDLSHVIPMDEVAPTFSNVNPAYLNWGILGRGVTQVMFDRGHLTEDAVSTTKWKFTPRLSPSTVSMNLASEVKLTMRGLSTFKLRARALDTRSEIVQTLTAADGGTIKLTICHFCEHNPLLWDTRNFKVIDDEDVKWYFELLKVTGSEPDYLHLLQTLSGNELPIPRPTNSNGQGADCSPAKMTPASFILD